MGYAITKKGQVTIPKWVRDELNLKPRDEVNWRITDSGDVILQPKMLSQDSFENAIEEAKAVFDLGMSTDEWLDMTRGADRRDATVESAA